MAKGVGKGVAKHAVKQTTKGKPKRSAAKRRPPRKRMLARGSLRTALHVQLKLQGARKDIQFEDAPKVSTKTMKEVPLEDRAGYPAKRGKGSVDPKDWTTKGGKKVLVDFSRAHWLPDEWGQGVKWTNPTAHSTGGTGGTYTVYMAPDGEVFYHKFAAEDYAGKKFTAEDGRNGQIRSAQLHAKHQVQLARAQIKEIELGDGDGGYIGLDKDETLFRLLSKQERGCLPSKDELHFCVVSARRADKVEGVRDIFTVQTQLMEAGIEPTWYVDEASLQDYRRLGLKAVVGGPLTAARNKALDDAKRLRKACVQLSDDISAWEFRDGKRAVEKTDDAANKAHAAARRLIVSPAAAARFILAKMRGVKDGPKPQLGGVYMLSSCSRTFAGDEFGRLHFIIGDFFVADKSSVRFDEEMKLKEDYDFTAAHIHAHGSVMRCNRMTLNVKHYSNSGGAVTARDSKGVEEKRNIAILFRKWPRAFRLNPSRRNEVIMKWRANGAAEDESQSKAVKVKAKAKVTEVLKKGKVKMVLKKGPVSSWRGPKPSAKLQRTGKASTAKYMIDRHKKAAGKTVAQVLEKLRFMNKKGSQVQYQMSDLRYDIEGGFLRAVA